MNRERARDAIFGLLTDWLPYADKYDEAPMQERTDRMLDAILPQVTTVEELEALPAQALLLGTNVGKFPAVFRWTNGQLYYEGGRFENLVSVFGPLTVVWQP